MHCGGLFDAASGSQTLQEDRKSESPTNQENEDFRMFLDVSGTTRNYVYSKIVILLVAVMGCGYKYFALVSSLYFSQIMLSVVGSAHVTETYQ